MCDEEPASTEGYREEKVGSKFRGWMSWSMDAGADNPPSLEILADKDNSTFGAPKNDEQ